MKINKKHKLFLGALSMTAAFFAVPHTLTAAPKNNQWYVGISGGLSMPSQTKQTTLAASSNPADPYDFVMSADKVKSNYAVNLSAGMLFHWERKLLPSMRVGFMYSYQGEQQQTGTVFDALQHAVFNNNYKYQLKSDVVLFEQAFELVHWNNITPYVHTGIGVAQNSASKYQEADGSYITNYQFANKSTTGFAYLLGLGVDYKLNRQWKLSLAYDYLNQGSVSLGNAINPVITSPNNHLTNQMISLGVRYEFAQ
jgi:opacity protein-like surface antigen